MKLLVALLPCLAAAITWQELEANPSYSYNDWLAEYNPKFVGTEQAFIENIARIRAQNARKFSSWKAGVNQFTGMSRKEFKDFIGRGYSNAGPHMAAARERAQALDLTTHRPVEDLPASLDWRTKGVVTPVKNQGGCGGCWSFSAAETLESHIAIRTGKLMTFSEQEILACTPNPNQCGGTGGCNGATQELAFDYVSNAGITTEQQWPYTETTGHCNWSGKKPVANITGYVFLPQNNYSALMNAVVSIGPIAISAAAEPWQIYGSGIFDSQCGADVDHAIVLVGYGTQNNKDYYLVRNSWGAGWGEQGYIRIIRKGGSGTEPCFTDTSPGDGDGCKGGPKTIQVCGWCGILSDSSYPVGGHLL